MKANKIIIIILMQGLVACSTVPKSANHTAVLSTEMHNSQYYYCESCAVASELSPPIYEVLTPDQPPIINQTKIIKETVKLKKHTRKPVKKHQARKPKPKLKQCILWSK